MKKFNMKRVHKRYNMKTVQHEKRCNMKRVQHEKKSATRKSATQNECNMKRVQHKKGAAWSDCNMEQNDKSWNMEKLTRVKYPNKSAQE